MRVCMYVGMYVCMYACMHVYMYVCVYVCYNILPIRYVTSQYDHHCVLTSHDVAHAAK